MTLTICCVQDENNKKKETDNPCFYVFIFSMMTFMIPHSYAEQASRL